MKWQAGQDESREERSSPGAQRKVTAMEADFEAWCNRLLEAKVEVFRLTLPGLASLSYS